MRHTWLSRYLLILLSCALICLLSACDMPWSSASSSQAPTGHIDGPVNLSTHPPATLTPRLIPTTQTSCPKNGTARALVMTPLATGSHPTIVYSVSESHGNAVTLSMLKSYDLKTGSKKVIVQIPNQAIFSAEVSPDGQWILYGIGPNTGHSITMLQAVRVDGQGQQTLYCSPDINSSIHNPQWSPDQKKVAFQEDNQNKVQVLDLATGILQTVYALADFGLVYHSWLDSQHVYLYEEGQTGGMGDIYVLDITKGANQTQNNFTMIQNSGYRTTLTSSYDRSQIYATYNGCDQQGCKPPSSIVALPALGGTRQTLWQSTQYAATTACPVTARQLLFTIMNENYNVDTSHNGVWIINNDGTGIKQISSSATPSDCSYPWEIVSRDGSMYAIRQNGGLAFGKLDGSSSPTIFASGSSDLGVFMVGWTMT